MAANRIALIPAYEPDEQLLTLLDALKSAGLRAIVVDDGSGGAFAPVFRTAAESAEVLGYPVNRGKGSALKAGYARILEEYGEACTVVTMDCDGQHTVQDGLRLLAAAEAERGTLILGSRRLWEGTPLRSLLGNTATRLAYSFATGRGIHDTQTGLRAFDGSLLPLMLSIPGERYEYEMNVLLECPRRKIPMRELEIEMIYMDNNTGSHFNTVRDALRVLREILKFSASSIVGFVTDYVLYTLLLLWSESLTFSNVAARVISASVNFTLNRKLVFKSEKSLLRSAAEYALLASLILAGNTVVLHLLVDQVGMNRWLAKLITEILFFLCSWLVQRYVIFRKKSGGQETKGADAA